jgi:hypothetical protein
MRWSKVFAAISIILLTTGCSDFFMICSLNPYYLEKNITLVPELEGSWTVIPVRFVEKPVKKGDDGDNNPEPWKNVDTTSVWKIERRIVTETAKTKQGKDSVSYKPLDFYTVKLNSVENDSTIYQFKMTLFRVNKVLYADFMPYEISGLDKSRMATENYFKIHTLARVNFRDRHPEFSWLGASNMKEMIEGKRVRVNYRWVNDAGRLLLVGTSDQLTGMIERYAGEPRFIDWEKQPAMLKLNRIN